MPTVLESLETKFQALVDATPGQNIPDLGLVQTLAAIKTAKSFPAPTISISNVTTLTQPDQGITLVLAGRTKVSIGVKVTNINTSVAIRLSCSLVESGELYPLSADGNATMTITSNGNYLYTWEGTAAEIYVAFASEVGGTSAQVNVHIRAQ